MFDEADFDALDFEMVVGLSPGSMLAEIIVLVEGHVATEIVVSPSEAEVFLVYSIEAILQPINEGIAEATVDLVDSVLAEIVGGQNG